MKTKIITPKKFKENSKVALKKTKEKLVEIVLKEKEIKEEKNKIINEIFYWESMIK